MKSISVENYEMLMNLFGSFDKNAELFAEELNVKLQVAEGGRIIASGEENDERLCVAVLEKCAELAACGERLDTTKIRYLIGIAKEGKLDEAREIFGSVVAVNAKGKPINCKTLGQKRFVQAVRKNSIVIAVGPAGTGKTYLAVALAVSAYKNKEIDKIILTRPAVEAGEKLGFLPGDLQMKVDPYLRPLYDALSEMLGADNYLRLIERQIIEVAPLAYMRGRTLSNAFIILDEAQNTSCEQMKMFLTRIGEGSKMVVNGDVTQIDLPHGQQSGLKQAVKALEDVKGISVVQLSAKDVVRHELVQNIINAYERFARSADRADKNEKKL